MIQKPGGIQVSKQDSLGHSQCKVCVSGHPEATKVQKFALAPFGSALRDTNLCQSSVTVMFLLNKREKQFSFF